MIYRQISQNLSSVWGTEEHKLLFSLTRFLSSRRLERPNHGHFGLDFDHFGLIYTYIWMNWSENIWIKQYIYQKKSLICMENSSKKLSEKRSNSIQDCRVVPGHKALKIALLYINFSSSFTRKNLRAHILIVLELEAICRVWSRGFRAVFWHLQRPARTLAMNSVK